MKTIIFTALFIAGTLAFADQSEVKPNSCNSYLQADAFVEYQQLRDQVRAYEEKTSKAMAKLGRPVSTAEYRREHLISIMRYHIANQEWKKAAAIANTEVLKVQEAANAVKHLRPLLLKIEKDRLDLTKEQNQEAIKLDTKIVEISQVIVSYEKKMATYDDAASMLRYLNYLIKQGLPTSTTAEKVLWKLKTDFNARQLPEHLKSYVGDQRYQFMSVEELKESFDNSRTMTTHIAKARREMWMQRWSLYWFRLKAVVGAKITQSVLAKALTFLPQAIQAELPDAIAYLRDYDEPEYNIPRIKELLLQKQSSLDEKVEQLRDFEFATLISFARLNQSEVEKLWNDLKKHTLIVIANKIKTDSEKAKAMNIVDNDDEANIKTLAAKDLNQLQKDTAQFSALRDHKIYDYIELLKDMKKAEEKARKYGPLSEYLPRTRAQFEASALTIALFSSSYFYDQYGSDPEWLWNINHWIVQSVISAGDIPAHAQTILQGLGF